MVLRPGVHLRGYCQGLRAEVQVLQVCMEHLRHKCRCPLGGGEGPYLRLGGSHRHQVGAHGPPRAPGQDGPDHPGFRLAAGAPGVDTGERFRALLVELPPAAHPDDRWPRPAQPADSLHERPEHARCHAAADLLLLWQLLEVDDLHVRAHPCELAPDLLDAGQPGERVVRPRRGPVQAGRRLCRAGGRHGRLPARDLQGCLLGRRLDARAEAEGHQEPREEDGTALPGGGHLERRHHRQGRVQEGPQDRQGPDVVVGYGAGGLRPGPPL
mmetsp:Transcript_14543/g.45724  ORF Transcript_14543/g.45724 Transcript_14543/m.45724 type:complete len:269 (-) Transcript_14543:297-1103(-)